MTRVHHTFSHIIEKELKCEECGREIRKYITITNDDIHLRGKTHKFCTFSCCDKWIDKQEHIPFSWHPYYMKIQENPNYIENSKE